MSASVSEISRAAEYADGDAPFAAYLEKCDSICIGRIGLSIFDLEDIPWRDNFDDGVEPRDAVQELIEYAGYYSEQDEDADLYDDREYEGGDD